MRQKILGNVGKFLLSKITKSGESENQDKPSDQSDIASHLLNVNQLEKLNLPKDSLAKITSSI